MLDIDDNLSIGSDIARIIWDLSPIVIAIIDEDGRFMYVNQMAQNFWEYTEAELKNKKWQEITHPEDLAADKAMHKMLLDGRQNHYTMSKRYLTKSGKVVWGNLTVYIMNDKKGSFVYFLSQVIPIDSHSTGDNIKNSLEIIDEINKTQGKGKSESSGSIMKHLKDSWTGAISLLFVIIGGIYVLSHDLGANKQKINEMEKRMIKVEEKTGKIDDKMDDIKKLLIEIINEKEVDK